MDEGHCGLPTDELVSLAEKLLEVRQDLIRGALALELADGTVVGDRVGETDCVFLANLYRAERGITATPQPAAPVPSGRPQRLASFRPTQCRVVLQVFS